VPDNFGFSIEDVVRFLPEVILIVMGTVLMVLDPVINKRNSPVFGHLSILTLIAAALGAGIAYQNGGPAFGGMLMVDGFATFFRLLVIAVGILTILPSYRYLRRQDAETSEFHALLLFSVSGQCLMAASNDLIMVFIGLEISSISSYVLAGYLRDDKRATEAALKYFLLGSFATAFFLYGVALIYGSTKTVNLSMIRQVLTGPDAPSSVFIAVAAALMFVGLAFKVSAAPFQIWAPDVYQGAPIPVAAFLSAGPKAAAFAVLLRIFMTSLEPIGNAWGPLVLGAALLSMIVGNFAALLQTNIKRMLAYSSIAHAGYILMAVASQSETGVAAAMFYLVAYGFMNVGAFVAVSSLAGKGERYTEIEDFAGLGQKQPLAAAMFAIFLLSLIGVPLTGGFFGKFYIFKAAVDSHLVWPTVVGLLTSAVGAYYYLRVLVVMYMKDPSEATVNAEPLSPALSLGLIVPALGTLVLGIVPSWVLEFASKASGLAK